MSPSRPPESRRTFDSLENVAKHCGVDIIGFKHPQIDEPYEGLIVSSYVEVDCAQGEVGLKPGSYLLRGKRGLFYVDPADVTNKWRPLFVPDRPGADAAPPAPAPAPKGEDEDPSEPAPVEKVTIADEDLPEVPEDSEFYEWSYNDLKAACAEEGLDAKGKRPILLKRLHWHTHKLPGAETLPGEVEED